MRIDGFSLVNNNKIFNFSKNQKVNLDTLGFSFISGSVDCDGTFSTGESFQNVFDEMSRNVPDSTSTVQEKKTAISYINRMIACSDITPELKTYWQNKKQIIQQEIVRIQNEQKTGKGEKVADVWAEFDAFAKQFGKGSKTNVPKDRLEYQETYFSTCMSFYNRLLSCSDITPELRNQYLKEMNGHIADMQNCYRDYINNQEQHK